MVISSGKNNKPYESFCEEKLIKKSKRGDHKAFEELLFRNDGYIVGAIFGFSKGRYDEAELYQKSTIKSWKYISKFRGDCKFSTWMYRIVRNICYDEYRRVKSSKEVSYESLSESQEGGLAWVEKRMPTIQPTGEKNIDMAFLKKILHRSIDKLSKNHKEVLLLFAEEGLSYPEIAEKMNCSVGTVMSRLFYARKKAQKHYKIEMNRVLSLTKEG